MLKDIANCEWYVFSIRKKHIFYTYAPAILYLHCICKPYELHMQFCICIAYAKHMNCICKFCM